MKPVMRTAKGFIAHPGGLSRNGERRVVECGRPRRTASHGSTRTSNPTFRHTSFLVAATTRCTARSRHDSPRRLMRPGDRLSLTLAEGTTDGRSSRRDNYMPFGAALSVRTRVVRARCSERRGGRSSPSVRGRRRHRRSGGRGDVSVGGRGMDASMSSVGFGRGAMSVGFTVSRCQWVRHRRLPSCTCTSRGRWSQR